MQQLCTTAVENATKAIVTLQLNYVKGAVVNVIMPMLTDALKEGLDEAKEEAKAEAGPESKEVEVKEGPRGRRALEERLARDEKEAQADTNVLHLESCPTQYAWLGPAWTGYQMYALKYGQHPKSNLFYSVGYEYTLRHSNMRQLDKRLRDEFKENKAAVDTMVPLPDDTLHGVKCGCMVRTVDAYAQYGRMQPYMKAIQAKPFVHSKSSAEFFRIGDDFEAQRKLKEVFDQAVIDTVEDTLGRPACKWCEFKDPFDETEAVRQLLYITAGRSISELRGMINPPFCAYNARQAAEGVLLAQLEVVANSWGAGQEALNKMKAQALTAVESAGATLVGALKPHLIKVLVLVQSKISKKPAAGEEKKEEKKEDKVKLGDVSYNWRFSSTRIGAKLMEAMHTGSTDDAIRHSESDLNPRTVLEKGIADIASSLGGDGIMDAPGIGSALRELTSKINDQIYRFNTLAPLLAAVRHLGEVRDKEEANLKAAATDPAKIAAAIEQQSAMLWEKGLGGALLKMFSSYQSIRSSVKSAYGGETPEAAATCMIEFCDYLYEGHVRALNALRVRYIQLLREQLVGANIESADRVAEHSKKCFAQAFFEISDILIDDFWVKMTDAIIVYACEQAFAAFKKHVWSEMAPLLDAIKSVLPPPVASANVHEAIILAVIKIVVNKAMTAITTKMLVWAEKQIFA